MSLLRASLLAQAIAATTKKHFKTSLSTLMGNAKQEDQALLKDKEEGHNDGGGAKHAHALSQCACARLHDFHLVEFLHHPVPSQ